MNAVHSVVMTLADGHPTAAPLKHRGEQVPRLFMHLGRDAEAMDPGGLWLDVRDAAGLDPDAAEGVCGNAPVGRSFSVSLWQDAFDPPVTSVWDAPDNLRCVPGDRRGSRNHVPEEADAGRPLRHLVDASRAANHWGLGRSASSDPLAGDGGRYRFHIGDGVDSLEEDEGVEAVNYGYGIFMDPPEIAWTANPHLAYLTIGAGPTLASSDALGARAGVRMLRSAAGADCPCAAPRTIVVREADPSLGTGIGGERGGRRGQVALVQATPRAASHAGAFRPRGMPLASAALRSGVGGIFAG